MGVAPPLEAAVGVGVASVLAGLPGLAVIWARADMPTVAVPVQYMLESWELNEMEVPQLSLKQLRFC